MAIARETRLLGLTAHAHNDSAYQGHAVPCGPGVMKLCIDDWPINRVNGPLAFFTQGRSVPISRGSPPFYDDA